jgi:4-amino-4-deoxy-L-arabinose transferase-like glycosyltransferase
LLAGGFLLGSPYIFLILMAVLLPPLIYLVGREHYDGRVGLLAGGLCLLSPAFVYASATLMNHTTVLFFLAVFTLCYFLAVPGRSPAYALLAGLAMGCALHIRPQDAVAYGLAFAVWSCVTVVRDRRREVLIRQGLMLAGFLVLLALFLGYNKVTTGQYLMTPYEYYRLYVHQKHPSAAPTEAYTPLKGLIYLLINGSRMNMWLFGWPLSLLFVVSYFARGNMERKDRIFVGVILAQCLVYTVFRKSPGVEELGPRYYFPLLIPLLLFSAKEIISLHDYFSRRVSGGRLQGTMVIPSFVALSFIMAFVTFHPEKGLHFRSLSEQVGAPYRAVEKTGISNAVVQIHSLPPSGWVFGYQYCKPDLSDDIIYVRATHPKDLLTLMGALPERKFYWLAYSQKESAIFFEELTREDVERDVRQRQQPPGPSV